MNGSTSIRSEALGAPSGEAFGVMRKAMVESQLRTNDVNDPALLAALLTVPRERFVPEALTAAAYTDRAVPLGGGRVLNPPLATARLVGEARIKPGDRVLLIGSATGYAAALLAALGAHVVAVEEDDALIATARGALAGQDAVTLVNGPLAKGSAKHGPYDALIIDGAVEELPAAFADQLRIDARVAYGLLDAGVTRLCYGVRTAGGFGGKPFVDAECVVLPGFARPRGFVF